MKPFNRFIKTVPAWAITLVLIAIFVNSLYLYFKYQLPDEGHNSKFENGYWIYDYINPGGPADKAGMEPGDRVVTINSMPVEEFTSIYRGQKAGDTVKLGFIRNNQEMTAALTFCSRASYISGFLWTMYVIMLLLSIGSLYIIFKKPNDPAAKLFFIYLLIYAINQNTYHLPFKESLSIFADIAFSLSVSIIGPILINFHLIFPKAAKIYLRFRKLPIVFYVIGFLFFIVYSARGIWVIITGFQFDPVFDLINNIAIWWMIGTFLIAISIAIYQFITIKDTLSRNQLRLVIAGSCFYFTGPIIVTFFPSYFYPLAEKYPYFFDLLQGIGSLVMISFILVAIFRYRIWDIGIIVRKALLYLGATLIITLSYFFIIFLVNRLSEGESDLTRFLSLAISIIVFLVLRDRLQRLIDRLFHRESYDSATVVSSFEEKLAGIYQSDELKSKIVHSLDEIFHFKSFVFNLKKNDRVYEPAFALGSDHQKFVDFEVTPELEKKLQKSKVFSPGELDQKTSPAEFIGGELVVPLMKEDQPYGFFVCGQKKSEKSYSMQDIRVLSLIAKRVIALFQTASLYQKDLDRQLMLERERTRISQDMHDDVGASLTRISILSDLAKNKSDTTGETRQWLGQISDTSRGVMEEMNQIIWALNPKNDTLEGLVAYLRRFVFEYLEPTTVNCAFELPEVLPNKALSVEFRRNIYLVVREALHNVVKHSGATKVLISMKMQENGFRIIIKDDGSGFDPGKLEFPGNGLINMKKRMNDIGGELLIHSQDGDGTEIELIVN